MLDDLTLTAKARQHSAAAAARLRWAALSLIAALLWTPVTQAGPVLWIDDSNNILHTVDLDTRQSTRIGAITGANETMTDIAMAPGSGELWGISNRAIWRLNRTTAVATRVGAHGIPSGNALTFDSAGRLFAAGAGNNRLYAIDLGTGVATALPGSMGNGSAGDLAFANDVLYLADASGRLTRLLLSGAFPYTVSPAVVGTMSVSNVFGLALASDASGRLFATAGATVYVVNTGTAALTAFSTLPAGVVANGATSESFASATITPPPAPTASPSNLALLRDLKFEPQNLSTLLNCGPPAGATPVAGRRRNLVLLVHGWNSDPAVWALPLREQIRAAIPQAGTAVASESWDLCVLDWKQLGDLGSATIAPWNAYANAPAVAAAVAGPLRDRYRYVHLVAHSAGSLVIELLTRSLKVAPAGSAPIIHATYLDAYEPGSGIRYGCSADWAESYVDTRTPDIFGLLRDTNRRHPCAFNIDVSAVDPVSSALIFPTTPLGIVAEETRVHAWPYQLYNYTAGLSSAGTATLDPVGAFTYGFGLTKVSGRRTTQNPNQWVPLIADRDANGLPEVPSHAAPGLERGTTACLARLNEAGTFRTRTVDCSNGRVISTPPQPVTNPDLTFADFAPIAVNDWFGPSAQSTPSTNGRVTLNPSPDAFLRLTNQSPAWVTYAARLGQAIDTLQFDYRYTAGNTGNGLLSVFVDNQLVYRMTQALTPSGTTATRSGPISIGRLDPGFHTLAFRLDMLSDTPSEITLSNLQVGTMTVRRATNVAPVAAIAAPRQARLNSRVVLDGSASRDDDPNPTALTYRWTSPSGPSPVLSDPSVPNPSFSPSTAGDYRVQLVVRDLATDSAAATATLTVPVLGDVDLDGDVDRDDAGAIRTAIGATGVSATDIRDLNGDLALTEADVTEARSKCTVANCGDPVAPPAAGGSSSGGGGGGGALTSPTLLALLALVLTSVARWPRRHADHDRRNPSCNEGAPTMPTANSSTPIHARVSARRPARSCLAWLACALTLLAAPGAEAAPMTNQEVIDMLKAGIPESTIVLAVQRDTSGFKTAPADLIQLKKQGVTQPVLDAMLGATNTGSGTAGNKGAGPAPGLAAPGNAAFATAPTVVAVDADGQRVALKQAAAGMRTNMWGLMIPIVGKAKTKVSFAGSAAAVRLRSPTPGFEVPLRTEAHASEQVFLIRMHPTRDSRDSVDATVSQFGSIKTGPTAKDRVEITIAPLPGRAGQFGAPHRISPKSSLEPGEYAINVQGTYYDFGIDASPSP